MGFFRERGSVYLIKVFSVLTGAALKEFWSFLVEDEFLKKLHLYEAL